MIVAQSVLKEIADKFTYAVYANNICKHNSLQAYCPHFFLFISFL